jgi:Na+/H+-translocating membrane pyrophosphatase
MAVLIFVNTLSI